MTTATLNRPKVSCGACAHFNNDPVALEKAFPGLTAMSSGFASVKAEDGLCRRHDLYLSAWDSCPGFERKLSQFAHQTSPNFENQNENQPLFQPSPSIEDDASSRSVAGHPCLLQNPKQSSEVLVEIPRHAQEIKKSESLDSTRIGGLMKPKLSYMPQTKFIAFCEIRKRYEGGIRAWITLWPYLLGALVLEAIIDTREFKVSLGSWMGYLIYLICFPPLWRRILNTYFSRK